MSQMSVCLPGCVTVLDLRESFFSLDVVFIY